MGFKVPYMMVADTVQEVQNAKLNILGTFDQIYLPEIPSQYHGFVVVALLVAETEDELGEHKISVRLI